jgi:4-amino-4-deoxy-L-arabinose transferase-like glycosyltransferase
VPLLGKHASVKQILLFLTIFALIVLAHAGLLTLPYFWDEAGYYIPYAHDFFLSGSLFPTSTIPNPHPPLPAIYLALWWKLFGFLPLVTRLAMLLVAAFGILQFYRVAFRVANQQVAVASTLAVAVYPVIFAQSSLAHADLAAFALSLWGLRLYLEERWKSCALALSLAVLSKETAILFPAALILWEIGSRQRFSGLFKRVILLLLPVIPLAGWFIWHYRETGFLFGDPEFYRYNAQATTAPARVVMAFFQRLWQVVGYMNLWVLTLVALAAMILPPFEDAGKPRPRISMANQTLFLLLVGIYVLFHSLVGGAVLARYLLPVIPLVILVWISTIWRRVREWKWVVTFILAVFVTGWFINPPQRFAPEDNLNYRHFVHLHQEATRFIQEHYPDAAVLTAWPATDELSHPYLGYVKKPIPVVRIENFTLDQLMQARSYPGYEVAFVFSTKYQPRTLLIHWDWWERLNRRYFGLHQDLPPALAAQILGGRIVMEEQRGGQWVAIVEITGAHLAQNTNQLSLVPASRLHGR